MAKKDYPGLVIVPPSDRTILRRRVIRWSLFLLISAIWIALTVMVWPPASQDDSTCQDATSKNTPGNPTEECGQSHQPTASIETRDGDVSLTDVSQAQDLAKSQHSTPSPTPENHQLSPAPTSHKDPTPKPSATENPPADRMGIGSNNEKSATHPPARKSTSVPTPDAQLAEHGDAFAQYRLGKYYAKQKGPEAPESVRWYKKASTGLRRLAEAGNGQAMYVLGVMYAYGRGVARNTEEARRWLTLAVQHNVTAAQPVLADLEAKQTAADSKQKGVGPTQTATPQQSLKQGR